MKRRSSVASAYALTTYTCCKQPRSTRGESLGQCCGLLKETQVCLTPQATVGVVGGYISLWLSICQAIYTGLVLIFEYFASKQDGPVKLDQGDERDTEMIAAAETDDVWKQTGFKSRDGAL